MSPVWGTGIDTYQVLLKRDPNPGSWWYAQYELVQLAAETGLLGLTCFLWRANGQPGFLIGGAAGFTYTVQASTNLLNWQNLYTNAPGSLPAPWTDTAAGGFAQRYYRVLLAP